MSATKKLPERLFPTGLVLFGPLPNTEDYFLMWSGRGGSLKLVIRPFSADGQILAIEHPTADGAYETRAEARLAANAFASHVKEVAGA